MTSWVRWADLVADAIRRFAARNGEPHLIVVNRPTLRRMSIAACAKGTRYAELRGLGTVHGVLPVVVEPDMGDGFALVRAEQEAKKPRSAG